MSRGWPFSDGMFDDCYSPDEEVDILFVWDELPLELKWKYEDELREENPRYFEQFRITTLQHRPGYVPRD